MPDKKEESVQPELVEAADKKAAPAKKKVAKKAKNTVSVKNTSGLTQRVAGVTIKDNGSATISKANFDAYKRGAHGHSLIAAKKIVAK